MRMRRYATPEARVVARPRSLRPRIEPLEGRVVPATITVLNANNAGAGSLRAAITQANLDPAPNTIDYAPSVQGTITLLTALPNLSTSINLSGPGASNLTVARAGSAGNFRIITVTAGAVVSISGLTITGGRAGSGGGISNSGALTVTAST